MPEKTVYISQAPAVAPGIDGLVHVAAGCGLPPRTMTRSVAIALARGLLASVATLEDRETAPEVVSLQRCRG